ncbi:MAG: hypothetical protein EA369_08535 [Bradymonadales bacterium]|nr:MAG: hypothetical protein EA369_08535 [Bradymonadales bacterium]
MDAELIFEIRFSIVLKSGEILVVFMDLYKIPRVNTKDFPGGHRFSWIAFDPEAPERRVLFDSHPPKGPHIHIDDELEGKPFEWVSVDQAKRLFFKCVKEHFGKFAEDIDI